MLFDLDKELIQLTISWNSERWRTTIEWECAPVKRMLRGGPKVFRNIVLLTYLNRWASALEAERNYWEFGINKHERKSAKILLRRIMRAWKTPGFWL